MWLLVPPVPELVPPEPPVPVPPLLLHPTEPIVNSPRLASPTKANFLMSVMFNLR